MLGTKLLSLCFRGKLSKEWTGEPLDLTLTVGPRVVDPWTVTFGYSVNWFSLFIRFQPFHIFVPRTRHINIRYLTYSRQLILI